MTITDTEKAQLKLRAISYINEYRQVVGLDKAKACALILVNHMELNTKKLFNPEHYSSPADADFAYDYYESLFVGLRNAINAY